MYIFTNFTKNDSFIEFVESNGNKHIYATNVVIFVDDSEDYMFNWPKQQDYISIKLTASRKTVGLLKKN